MTTPHRRIRLLLACTLLAAASACGKVTEPDPLIGTFIATRFTMTPAGQGTMNVLALGGTLGLNVANNYVVRGTLIIPPAVNGGATADLSGSAARTDSTVVFTQANATFLADLTFTLAGNELRARDQAVNGTTYDVVLTRQ